MQSKPGKTSGRAARAKASKPKTATAAAREPTKPLVRQARDFEQEEAELRERLDQPEAWKAVYALENLQEEWARALIRAKAGGSLLTRMKAAARLGIELGLARDVAEHLAQAEKWQAEIGTYATGSGEGLLAISGLRDLQLARAWVLVGTGPHPSVAPMLRDLLQRLAKGREHMAARQRRELDALTPLAK